MRKLSMIVVALSLALLLAAPAMALETTFSGAYRVRGFTSEHPTLSAQDAENAYMDSRLRLQTVFKVSDNLKLTTRFDALDGKVWGLTDDPDTNDKHNIDFDRVYVNIKTSFGMFDIGRMSARAFGTKFADAQIDRDRVKYTLSLGDLTLLAVYGKKETGTDHLNPGISDGDKNGYSLAGVYKMESGVAGLLLHLESDQTVATIDRREFFVNPFVDVAITDNVKVLGELKYEFGEWDYDAAIDDDIARFAANIEATSTFGPLSIMVGYAHMNGDADFGTANDDHEQTWFKGGTGFDWDRLWILTSDEDKSLAGCDYGSSCEYDGLGGSSGGSLNGNLTNTLGTARFGAKIIYIGASMSPMEGLNVGLVFASSKAEDVPSGWSDEHGLEWDFNVSYKIFDNLSYDFIAAFLAAGDFWKAGDPNIDLENTYSLYHQLKLKF